MRKPDEEKYASAMTFWRQLGLTSADTLLKTGITQKGFYKSQFKELDICLGRDTPMIFARTIGEFGRSQRLEFSLLPSKHNKEKIQKLADFIDGLEIGKAEVPMIIGYGTFNPRGAPTLEYFSCGERETIFVSDYVEGGKK